MIKVIKPKGQWRIDLFKIYYVCVTSVTMPMLLISHPWLDDGA